MVMALLTALATLLHYRMVALIGAGVLWCWWDRRWGDGFIFGMIASAPLGVVLAMNWLLAGTATGPRAGAWLRADDAIGRMLTVFAEMSLIVGVCFAVGGLVYYVLRRVDAVRQPDDEHQRAGSSAAAPGSVLDDPARGEGGG